MKGIIHKQDVWKICGVLDLEIMGILEVCSGASLSQVMSLHESLICEKSSRSKKQSTAVSKSSLNLLHLDTRLHDLLW